MGRGIRDRRQGDWLIDELGQSPRFMGVGDVRLKMRRGSVHALIGPNGAGKTTFFNLLTKFLPATSGHIFYRGEDITHHAAAEVARSGMVRSFQISVVFPHLPVTENVRVAYSASRAPAYIFGGPSPRSTP